MVAQLAVVGVEVAGLLGRFERLADWRRGCRGSRRRRARRGASG